MSDTVQVPREPTPQWCIQMAAAKWWEMDNPADVIRTVLAAAPPVAAEPAWFVVETPGADFDWSFFKTEAEARYATHRGDGSDPVITPLYTHPKAEPVNQQLLEALRLIQHATAPTPDDGGGHEAAYEIASAAIAAAEAQPALPAGWLFKRNADGSVGIWAPDPKPGESPRTSDVVYASQNRDLHELLGKLADHQAALSALPKGQPKEEYTMGDWFRDLENPHGNR